MAAEVFGRFFSLLSYFFFVSAYCLLFHIVSCPHSTTSDCVVFNVLFHFILSLSPDSVYFFFVLFFLHREKSFAFVVKICLGILISGSPFYHEAKRIYIAYQTCKLVYWLSCCGAR